MEQTDEIVMLAVQQGKKEQLGVLFQRHQRGLFRYFFHLTRHQSMSEDLVQESFVRILRSAATFRPGGSFPSWMYQVARSAYFDQMRKKVVHGEVPLFGPEDGVGTPSDAAGPESIAVNEQEAALIRHALDRLSAEKRELLIMTRYQDLSYSEIAAITNCEVATVKVRIHRALDALRKEYRNLTQKEHWT
jgi:RNA polymerase sigma factor (sigma-70 family)